MPGVIHTAVTVPKLSKLDMSRMSPSCQRTFNLPLDSTKDVIELQLEQNPAFKGKEVRS